MRHLLTIVTLSANVGGEATSERPEQSDGRKPRGATNGGSQGKSGACRTGAEPDAHGAAKAWRANRIERRNRPARHRWSGRPSARVAAARASPRPRVDPPPVR